MCVHVIICLCVHVYLCMRVCMCTHVHMCVCMFVCMCLCVHGCGDQEGSMKTKWREWKSVWQQDRVMKQNGTLDKLRVAPFKFRLRKTSRLDLTLPITYIQASHCVCLSCFNL